MTTTLKSTTGKSYTILKKIAQGGQGAVAKARCNETGAIVAAKLLNTMSPEQLRPMKVRLESIIDVSDKLPPVFVLPREIIESPKLGYVMDFVDDHVPLESVLSRREINKSLEEYSFSKRVQTCFRLAQGFKELHTRGLCYADISWSNVLVNCRTGSAKIIDNDNLDGTGRAQANILGTPWFIAPELISQKQSTPCIYTDYHALATLIYYILVMDHPLIGDRVAADSQENEEIWLSSKAVFVHDDKDRSNRSQFGELFNRLPMELRQLFRKSFGPGLIRPTERVPNGKWMTALMRTIDEMSECSSCGERNFYPESEDMDKCIYCSNGAVHKPMLLSFRHDGRTVRKSVLPGAKILAHHWQKDAEFDLRKSGFVGVIMVQKGTGYVYKNVSTHHQYASYEDEVHQIGPSRSILIRPGMEFNFGASRSVTAIVERPLP